MARVALVIVLAGLAGCGRLQFDEAVDPDPDAVADADPFHDEDGDGLPDASDLCPHDGVLGGDFDQDAIGDACDPEPDIGRQRLLRFSTLRPGDQPFVTFAENGTWTQGADALEFAGGFGHLDLVVPLDAVTIEIGFEITAVTGGDVQHQIAIGVGEQVPVYFAELNEVPTQRRASLTKYDGTDYIGVAFSDLLAGVHTGNAKLRLSIRTGSAEVRAGWAGDEYTPQGAAADYQGGASLVVNVNNLDVAIRYVWIVETR